MAIEISKVRRFELGAITSFLRENWKEYIAPPLDENVHVSNWVPGDDDFGLKLLVDGRLVGFLGASYSLRTVRNVGEKFCAIAPWFVMPEHRKHSLSMLARLLADPTKTYVNLTPSREMFNLFTRLGFKKLDEVKLIILPFFCVTRLRFARCRLVLGLDEIREALPEDQKVIFDMHQTGRCFHAAVISGGRCCYVVASRRLLRGCPFAELLHVSDPSLLSNQLERLVWYACLKLRAVGVVSDERLMGGGSVPSIKYRLNSPPLFRSKRVTRFDVTNLYSELVL